MKSELPLYQITRNFLRNGQPFGQSIVLFDNRPLIWRSHQGVGVANKSFLYPCGKSFIAFWYLNDHFSLLFLFILRASFGLVYGLLLKLFRVV